MASDSNAHLPLVRSRSRVLTHLGADGNWGDFLFRRTTALFALAIVVLIAAMAIEMTRESEESIARFGLDFVFGRVWDPVRQVFGALPFIFGTVVSSLLALTIAVPISLGIAIYLFELAPGWARTVLGFLVELLAAIPSVVYGLWGIFVLAPWLRENVQPALGETLGFLPLFQGPPYGVGMMSAGLILAIMITPTISSISREVFKTIPQAQREAVLALGSTRWEMMNLAVLKGGRTGVFGAVILGLGRALGETMAVTMVIGNRAEISASLFAPSQTMASVIANEYAEASSGLHL